MHAGWFANEPPQMSPPGPNPGLVEPCKQKNSLLCSETARAFQGAGSPEKRRRPRRFGAICYITQGFRICVRPPIATINRAGFPGCGRCCVFFDILALGRVRGLRECILGKAHSICRGARFDLGPLSSTAPPPSSVFLSSGLTRGLVAGNQPPRVCAVKERPRIRVPLRRRRGALDPGTSPG